MKGFSDVERKREVFFLDLVIDVKRKVEVKLDVQLVVLNVYSVNQKNENQQNEDQHQNQNQYESPGS